MSPVYVQGLLHNMRMHLRLVLAIDNVTNALTIRNYLAGQIAGMDVEVIQPINSMTRRNGNVLASWMGWFNNRTEFIALYNDLEAKATLSPFADAILAARVVRHDCRHDEDVGNCTDAVFTYVKGAGFL